MLQMSTPPLYGAVAGIAAIVIILATMYAFMRRSMKKYAEKHGIQIENRKKHYNHNKSRKEEQQPMHLRMLSDLQRNTRNVGVSIAELQMGKLLGKGSQAEVYLAMFRGSKVAVKKIDTRTVDPGIIEEFIQEANIMRGLRHPNLTLFMGVSLNQAELCIVTEFISRGSLFDIIHDENSGFTWPRSLRIAIDVAKAMSYLHSASPPILHRDLKSLNILISDNWRAKVADFGMSAIKEEGTMTQCGSPLWMSPEVVQCLAYDEKSDVYSFAICMWEMFTRKIPYRDLGLSPNTLVAKVVQNNLRPKIPHDMPARWRDIIERCWHNDPIKRPSFTEVLKSLEAIQNAAKIPKQALVYEGDDNEILLGSTAFRVDRTQLIVDESKATSFRKPFEGQVLHGIYRDRAVMIYKYFLVPSSIAEVGSFVPNKAALDLTNVDATRLWRIMSRYAPLRFPSLETCYGAYIEKNYVAVVHADTGKRSLFDVALDHSIPFPWETMIGYMLQIAQALEFLHAQSPPILHRSLDSNHIYLDQYDRIKVRDWAFISLDDCLTDKPIRPTAWSAPELYLDVNANSEYANVYSFGMICWQLITRSEPYDGKFGPKLRQKLVEGHRPLLPLTLPSSLRYLIRECWRGDCNKRPVFSQIVRSLKNAFEEGPKSLELIDAIPYRKRQLVWAFISKDPITLIKGWGRNKGRHGSYVMYAGGPPHMNPADNEEGDLEVLEPDVFNQRFEPSEHIHVYRHIGTIVAKRLSDPFWLQNDAGSEYGMAGDYLVENEKRDQWIVNSQVFESVYEELHRSATILSNETVNDDVIVQVSRSHDIRVSKVLVRQKSSSSHDLLW